MGLLKRKPFPATERARAKAERLTRDLSGAGGQAHGLEAPGLSAFVGEPIPADNTRAMEDPADQPAINEILEHPALSPPEEARPPSEVRHVPVDDEGWEPLRLSPGSVPRAPAGSLTLARAQAQSVRHVAPNGHDSGHRRHGRVDG